MALKISEDGNRIHEVMEMAKKIEHMSTVSSTAYTPMSLGFGVLETYTDVAPLKLIIGSSMRVIRNIACR